MSEPFQMRPQAMLEALNFHSVDDLRMIFDKYQDDIIDFRVPTTGEEVLAASHPFERVRIIAVPGARTPRFILRPRKKVTRTRIILEQLEDYPRHLNRGEVGINLGDGLYFRQEDEGQWIGRYIPCSQREETFEVFVD